MVYNKEYQRRWRATHREQRNATERKRYAAHIEKRRAANRKKYAAERAQRLAYLKNYYATHPARRAVIKASNLRWSSMHPEKVKSARARFWSRQPGGESGYLREWKREHPDRVRASTARYRRENPVKVRNASKKWRKTHPEKVAAWKQRPEVRKKIKARSAAGHAKIPATVCSNCGSKERLQRHHPDYDKPLEVVILCRPCHKEEDKKNKKPKVIL